MKEFIRVYSYPLAALVIILIFCAGVAAGKASVAQTAVSRVVLRESGYDFINPILLCNLDPTQTTNEDKILSGKLQTLVASQGSADVSVYVQHLTSGAGSGWAGVNVNQTYAPASMLKVPTMIAILRYAESHSEFLSKQIYYDGSFDDNKAQYFKPAQAIQPRHWYTVDQLLNYMIGYSDNNATKLLNNSIDQESLTEIYIDLGVQLSSSYIDFMSTKTYALFLRLLYNSTYLTREMSEKAIKLLTTPDFPQGLMAGVPSSVPVAQKYGERQIFNPDGTLTQRELHDCGIVYVPGAPYLICVMTKGQDFDVLSKKIQDVSKLVYIYMAGEAQKQE